MPSSSQQEGALRSVYSWFRSGPSGSTQTFRMFGHAGTGKTALARQIAEGIDGSVAFGAFTGKAASVMRARGCPGAGTLHSLIYMPVEEIDAKGHRRVSYRLNPDGEAAHAELIIIDECSMVDRQLANDLLSFGKPVLVLGDPFQLPPIEGTGFFTNAKPDFMLTEIHRQAADSPIIQLATQVREGKKLQPGRYGNSQIVRPTDLDPRAVIRADQVLVGRNEFRQRLVRRFRAFRGQSDAAPAPGDRLVCTRNNKDRGLYNGGLWTIAEVRPDRGDKIDRMYVLADDEVRDGKPRRLAINVRREFLEGTEKDLAADLHRRSDAFTYANALTVHKAQGSQWDHVVLFDESKFSATTRASGSIRD